MIGYAYRNPDDTYSLFLDMEAVPEWMRPHMEEITVPEGSGFLRKNDNGEFYYEILTPEPKPEPEPPEPLEEQIAKLANTMEQNNLITVDAVLNVYEELVVLREEVATLKEPNNKV